jgi:hypothetical protein
MLHVGGVQLVLIQHRVQEVVSPIRLSIIADAVNFKFKAAPLLPANYSIVRFWRKHHSPEPTGRSDNYIERAALGRDVEGNMDLNILGRTGGLSSLVRENLHDIRLLLALGLLRHGFHGRCVRRIWQGHT